MFPLHQLGGLSWATISVTTKHDLSLNADVLEKLLRHFSHLQFEDLRLVDTHLEVMGKATGGVKVFKFDRCEFSVEGTNFLFLREPESHFSLSFIEREVKKLITKYYFAVGPESEIHYFWNDFFCISTAWQKLNDVYSYLILQ